MELIFLSPVWQESKDIWEEARDMNVSLFVVIMPCPRGHRTQALGDFRENPPMVTHALCESRWGQG